MVLECKNAWNMKKTLKGILKLSTKHVSLSILLVQGAPCSQINHLTFIRNNQAQKDYSGVSFT